jgi:hypothetical protein
MRKVCSQLWLRIQRDGRMEISHLDRVFRLGSSSREMLVDQSVSDVDFEVVCGRPHSHEECRAI